uniref:permease n=1 Tax=Actinokineospora sp. CA-119265 TaxID=3239890 RepID=UPI003F49AE85
MAEANDLEARVAALEEGLHTLAERVRVSEHDAAAARVLAGGADRDVTEFRPEIREFREQNSRVLNVLREDLTDLRAKVDTGFTEMRGKLDAAATGQRQIVGLLNRLLGEDDIPTP